MHVRRVTFRVPLNEAPGLAGGGTQVPVIVVSFVMASLRACMSRLRVLRLEALPSLGQLPDRRPFLIIGMQSWSRDPSFLLVVTFGTAARVRAFRSRATRRSLRGSLGSRVCRHVVRVDRLAWAGRLLECISGGRAYVRAAAFVIATPIRSFL